MINPSQKEAELINGIESFQCLNHICSETQDKKYFE
jgi:hypothetical protein